VSLSPGFLRVSFFFSLVESTQSQGCHFFFKGLTTIIIPLYGRHCPFAEYKKRAKNQITYSGAQVKGGKGVHRIYEAKRMKMTRGRAIIGGRFCGGRNQEKKKNNGDRRIIRTACGQR